MAEIFTKKGHAILVDEQDLSALGEYEWHITADGYAATTIPHPIVDGATSLLLMHRFVLGMKFGDPEFVDHINGLRSDNRRVNLRPCTNAENQRNRGVQKNNTSGYKGVFIQRKGEKWVASIQHIGKRICLGTFNTSHEAAHAYNKGAIRLFGEFAVLNPVCGVFVDEPPKKRNHTAKLSEEDACFIRNSKEKSSALASVFGVDRRTIDRVRSGTHYAQPNERK